jgi:hypothetical protein
MLQFLLNRHGLDLAPHASDRIFRTGYRLSKTGYADHRLTIYKGKIRFRTIPRAVKNIYPFTKTPIALGRDTASKEMSVLFDDMTEMPIQSLCYRKTRLEFSGDFHPVSPEVIHKYLCTKKNSL